jgi:hypothetical protein
LAHCVVCETEAAFDYGVGQWDFVFTYEPFPITWAAYVERLGTALKLGGIIVVESLAQEDAAPNRTRSQSTRRVCWQYSIYNSFAFCG